MAGQNNNYERCYVQYYSKMKTRLRSLLSGLAVTLLLCSRKTAAQRSCQGSFRCDNGRCIREESKCNDEDNCGDNSDEEECSGKYGLILGITIPIGLTLCVGIFTCCLVVCLCRCMKHVQPVARTCVFESTGATTVVIPYRTRSVSTTASVAALSSTQQPATVNDDTQFSKEAPPSYDVASGFPSILQDGYQYQSNLIAADPEQGSRVTVQDQDPPTYSSIAPNANQNYRHLTILNPQTNGISLAIQQPDGLTLSAPQPYSLTQDCPQPDGITRDEETPQPDGLTRDTPQPDGLTLDTP